MRVFLSVSALQGDGFAMAVSGEVVSEQMCSTTFTVLLFVAEICITHGTT
jgi:hypothetical protein